MFKPAYRTSGFSVFRRGRTARKVFAITLALTLARLLIPVGYMPAPLASGWFVQLCPQGLSSVHAAAFFGDHHHEQAEGNTAESSLDDISNHSFCPLGGFAATMHDRSSVADIEFQTPDRPTFDYVRQAVFDRPYSLYTARSPPAV